MLLQIEDIVVNDNVRLTEKHIEDLARSMNVIGQISAITVAMNGDGRYHLVAGHRRLAAAKQLGWTEIRVEEVEAHSVLAIQLAENIARDELTDYEIAQGVLALQGEGLNQGQIADALGMDKKRVSTYQKIARGTAGLDALEVNQLSWHELSLYADVHDMPDNMREDFIKDHEKDNFRDGVWRVPDYVAEVEIWRWSQRKENKPLLKALDDIGAVPMSKQDRAGAVRLHGEEVDAHRGQPCHGWIIARSWSNIDEGYAIAEYCLDPGSHRKAKDPETGEDDTTLQSVTKAADKVGATGINQNKAKEKEHRARKQKRKEAVAAFARDPRIKPLMEAVVATLLSIQRPYRWNELGKVYGLTKPKDQFHFDWNEGYLDAFTPKDRLTQSLILAVGSVYIGLESMYSNEANDLLAKLDEIFGYNTVEALPDQTPAGEEPSPF